MPSLGRLSHLKSLILHVNMPGEQLCHLASLSSLQHCEIINAPTLSLEDAAPLFALTQLTHLSLIRLHYGHSVEDDTVHAGGQLPDASPKTLAALSQLGSLRQLCTLELGYGFEADQHVFPHLLQLPQLSDLTVGDMSGFRPHMTALRSLRIRGRHKPIDLHAMLALVLPGLSHLSLLDLGWIDISLDDSEGPAEQAAALRMLVHDLMLAPGIQLHSLTFEHADERAPHLPLNQVAQLLQPLAPRISDVLLYYVPLAEVDWQALSQQLPSLQRLFLASVVTDAVLEAIGTHLPSLKSLVLRDCDDTSDLGWCMLCAARTRPLCVDVFPLLSMDLMSSLSHLQGLIQRQDNVHFDLGAEP